MALQTIGSGSSASGISASYLNQLIAQTIALQSRPLAILKQEQDRLEVQRAVYQDLQGFLNNLKTQAQKLSSTTTSTYILGQKKATSSDQTILTASTLSSATVGAYTITDVILAQAHQVRSARQFAYADQALGLSGTFAIGGADVRSAQLQNGDTTVTATSTGTVASGRTELGSGDYYVEYRQQDSVWQFRVVDSRGNGVNVADAGSSGSYTTTWQNLADAQAEGTYDTGRGLKITFAADPAAGKLRPNAPQITYAAQGAQIVVDATDTLQDIQSAINDATYAEGHAVRATIVDNYLVLTALSTSADHAIQAKDISGTVLSDANGLALLQDPAGAAWRQTLQTAQNASLKVDDITVTRDRNTGLDDVISGMTLNLLKATEVGESIDLTVADDNAAATSQLNSFVSTFNQVSSYLQSKTATTQNDDGKTYTRGALAGDSMFTRLRYDLMSDITRAVDGLSPDAPKSLREIGISLSTETLQLTVSDGAALSQALATNHDGMAELLDAVVARLTQRVDVFTGADGASGLLSSSITTLDGQKTNLSNRISDMEERLTAQEALLTKKYGLLLAQLAQVQSQAYYMGIFNQQV
ncbi:MAG: flagellar filament capping protein FliD [Anaerolineae bacterium]|nr:flagellar filament capping protein FliD [Anaerolineae bacterium]